MTPINATFTLNAKCEFDSDFGWREIIVHNIYPVRVTTGRKHRADMGWRIKNLFFPAKGWRNEPFKKRLALLAHGHLFPGARVYHIDYAATATCDSVFESGLDWDMLNEEIAYGVYKPTKL